MTDSRPSIFHPEEILVKLKRPSDESFVHPLYAPAKHESAADDLESNAEVTPGAATLDTLPFGDDGARPILRKGDERNYDHLMLLMKEAAKEANAESVVPNIDRKDLIACQHDKGYLMMADIGDRLPVGFAVVTYHRDDKKMLSELIGMTPDEMKRTCQLETALIRPQWKGQNLLHEIVKEVLQIAKRQGYRTVLAATLPKHEQYTKMLTQLGFEKVSTVTLGKDETHNVYKLVMATQNPKHAQSNHPVDAADLTLAEALVAQVTGNDKPSSAHQQ